jgi:hypothetical protein
MEVTRIEAMYLARLVLYSLGREKRVRDQTCSTRQRGTEVNIHTPATSARNTRTMVHGATMIA